MTFIMNPPTAAGLGRYSVRLSRPFRRTPERISMAGVAPQCSSTKTADREWKATDHDGIERSLFRTNETGGRTSVVRLTQGSRFPRHAHEGTEEVVVLAGIVRIGGVELSTGDYLFTSPGEEHDVIAISDATIFVSSQKSTPVVEGR
jgi:quercetin dioxygenase-like cupin family protein